MAPRDSKSDPVTIGCNGPDAVRVMLPVVHRFIEERDIAIDPAAKLAIVVEELVANLVEHGGIDEKGEVELTLVHIGDGVLIELADSGPPFDPRAAVSDDVVPTRGGGAGIDLVRAWAEITDYRSADGWNRLSLRLNV